jgi:membrane protein implicated in regulation of membrane protease activity
MESLFLVCFLVGLCMTVLSLFLGVGHFGGIHLGHIGAHGIGNGEAGHGTAGHSGGAAADAPSLSTGFLNFTTVMTFVTWFGGVGYLISHYTALGGAVSLIVALASGVGGGSVVALFISRVLEQGQTQLNEADYRMPGTAARVTSTIYPGHAGEITYSQVGSTHAGAARSISDEEIPRGTEVVVIKYERGVAYVDTWQHALDEGSDALVRTNE